MIWFVGGVLICIIICLAGVVVGHLTEGRGQDGFDLEVCNHKRWAQDIKRFRGDRPVDETVSSS